MLDLNKAADVKGLNSDELAGLCTQLREEIIDSVSKNGGHLASNLGVVELTVALHRVFDLPNDKLIFDVGHQCYVHKLLTERHTGFMKLRNEGGVSGFQLRSESEYDFFGGGHSGTSISAAIGYAEACKLNSKNNYAIAVVGDGSFTNGMIYEALNNAATEGLRLIVVLNDNEMSISENVGAMSNYFGRLRTSANYYKLKRRVKKGLGKIKIIGRPIAFITKSIKNLFKKLLVKSTLFENLGIGYMGPVDGHSLKKLEAVLREAKYLEKPVLVHVCTQKGRGYSFAEESPELYHSVSKFDKAVGVTSSDISLSDNEYSGFSQCFGKNLSHLAEENKELVAVSAAMCEGTGLTEFKKLHSSRFFDVGIAEEHAVTFAAGLAASGKKPVVAIYSSFLQRAYDQIIHDVAIQELPVVFAIDRAGFVSGDGVTHQGIFDLAFLLQIPKMTVYTPERYSDMHDMLLEALNSDCPCAIRYQKGNESEYDRAEFRDFGTFRQANFGEGKKVTVITYGRTVKNAYDTAILLNDFCCVNIISLKKVKPLDTEALYKAIEDSQLVLFVEEQVKTGGLGEYVISELVTSGKKLPSCEIIAVNDDFPGHASIEELHKKYGMDASSLAERIKKSIT